MFKSLSNFFSRNVESFVPVLEVLYVWISTIIILIVLLLCFRCFTSPLKLASQKFRHVQRIARELESIKLAGGMLMSSKMRRTMKNIAASCVKIDRLILMYRFDNPEHMDVKDINAYTTRITNSVNASYSLKIEDEQKAMKLLIKNICKQSESAIKFLQKAQG